MKTAIIKTDFWEDDEIFELNSDTRLFYLCFLTNPKREVIPAFKVSDRLMSAYTGYNRDLIDICRKQLLSKSMILYKVGYYILTDQDYIKPSVGRDTPKIYEREFEKLPLEIQAIIEGLYPSKSTSKSTGTSSSTVQEHINIPINIDINNKHNNKYTDKDVELVKRLFTTVAQNFPNYKKLASRVPKDGDFEEMNKLHRIDENEYKLIEDILTWLFKGYKPSDTFDWKDQVKSVGNLRKHFDNLRLQYEKDKKSRRYVPNHYSDKPPGERKVPVPIPDREVKTTPEEAEKNRIVLDLVRAKKATFSNMKELKSKSIDELRKLL